MDSEAPGRVLHIGAELLRSTGGTTRAVLDFEAALPGSSVAALCGETALRREGPFADNWHYIQVPESPLGQRYLLPRRRSLKGFKNGLPPFGAVFCHMLYRYTANLVADLSREQRVPYFAVPHGSLDPWVLTYRSWQKKGWLRLFGRRFLRKAAATVFATAEEMRKASEVVSIDNGVVIHWPVDVPAPLDRHVKGSLRSRLGIPVDARVLLFFGRVHSSKRPIETIRAAVDADAPDLYMVFVGPEGDVSRRDCERAAEPLGTRFHWHGPAYGEDKLGVLGVADAYVSLSAKENFNYCLAEALGSGLAAIISPGNDLSHELRHVGCGWVLDDTSQGTAARAIREFAQASSDQLSAMGENGREFAEHELSRATFSARLRSLVEHARRTI